MNVDSPPLDRLVGRFELIRKENKPGLVTFITAGDPDFERSFEILKGLPAAGADVIELGMPFTDPMADGPLIQASGLRALSGGQTMVRTLELVRKFRLNDADTPIILMGYYNPIYSYGVTEFLKEAVFSGVDGLIVVDLPPEEDPELCLPSQNGGLHFIRLATPTTDSRRLKSVLKNTSGFLYYVSITGITGSGSSSGQAIQALRKCTDLPIAVGFGIKTPEQAAEIARHADAAVVGSALVERIAHSLSTDKDPVEAVLGFTRILANGVHSARGEEVK